MAETNWSNCRAGLEAVGEQRVEEVPPPAVMRRHVIGWQTEPTVAVADDRPDPIAELNAGWHRLASDAGILGGDGAFLIDFSGDQDRSWVRVRLTEGWDLAGVVESRPGEPEFLTLRRRPRRPVMTARRPRAASA